MTTSRASRASTGGSVLPGGAVGQVLTKRSGTNDDLAWGDINTTTYNNPTATGLVTAQAAGSNVEAVVSGMSVSNLQPGVVVSVNLLLYVSMNDFGTAKGVTMRLRDGGLTGTILQSVVRSLTTDTSTGHDQNFAFTGNVTPATNTLVVTVQRTSASTVAVLSDTRTFTVSQSGGGFTPIGGTTGQVLTKTSSTDLAYGWATPAAGGGGGGSTAVTTGTDTTLAATPQVLAQSAKSQVFGTTTLSPLVDTLLVIHVTANISSAGGNQGAFLGPLVASPQTGGQFGGRFSAGPAPVSPGITSMNQTIQNPLSGSLFGDSLYYLRAGVIYTIGYDLQAGSGVGSVTYSNLQAAYSTTPFGGGSGGSWVTYTPADITAVTTNPSLGTGPTKTGQYLNDGTNVKADVYYKVGTSPSAGSGAYKFAFPVPLVGFIPGQVVGHGWMYTSGVAVATQQALALDANFYHLYQTATPAAWEFTSGNNANWWAASNEMGHHLDYRIR
jgi:hypothetical protein